MKICFISPYYPKKCGISIYTKRIVDSLVNDKIDVKIIPFNSSSDIKNLYSKLKDNNPDIIRLEYALSIYGVYSLLVLAMLLIFKIKNKTKIIANFHEVKRETDLLGVFGKTYYYFISKLFDRVYVHTNEARMILNIKCKVGRSKIKVIPHGTYVFKYKENFSKELTEKFGLKNKKVILYFGYIHVDKGIQYLLSASKILLRQNSKLLKNTTVLISGSVRSREGIFKLFEKKDQTYLKKLINLNNELGLNDFVKFTGFIEDKYVYSLLKIAKVIVLPYTNVEQSGVLNLALAVHKPVIASSIGGLKETLQKAGVLVLPENAQEIANSIMKLFQDKKHYANIVSQYKEINYNQSTEQIALKLIKEYKNLIKA